MGEWQGAMEGLGMKSIREVYKGKTVLLTGHTGFKGGWMSLWLQSLGAKVVGYSLDPDTQPNLYEKASVGNVIDSHIADIRDYENLLNVMQSVKPDMVFHLAAQALVRLSYTNSRETFDVNVMGTANVLESLKHVDSVRACVVVTSDKCYENREWPYAYREIDPVGGHDPYSASKGAAEIVTAAYRKSFFSNNESVAVASARAGNVIGGGDWSLDRIVPDCMRSLSDKRPIPVRNPHSIRPWQHVLEPISGYLWLGACLLERPTTYSDAWNFGPDSRSHLTVREMVDKVVSCWGEGEWQDQSDAAALEKMHEATFLKLDCTKAHDLMQWRPVYSIDQCIQSTTDWYRNYYTDGAFNAQEFCLRQIQHYTKKAQEMKIAWAL